jgi:PAS domain S-box-containing protein
MSSAPADDRLDPAVFWEMSEELLAIGLGDGLLLDVNPAWRRLGYTPEEVLSHPPLDLVHPEDVERTRAFFDREHAAAGRVGDGYRTPAFENRQRRADGSFSWVSWTATIRDGLWYYRGTDITDQKSLKHLRERDREAAEWNARIRDALAEDRFTLHAQPIIDIAGGRVITHELLIRMLDRDGKLIPPAEFLPTAERYGLVAELDRWVVAQAARIAGRGTPVEVNLSAHSLCMPDLFDHVRDEFSRHAVDPSNVVFEITETGVLRDEEAASAFISHVKQLGCRIALDDFGTGYGGFTYLKRLPVDYLKIDIEFVRELPRDPASQHVVRAVVNLARGFGQRTVAEGVEDAETLELLRTLGVDYAQGYAIGRPRPLGAY